MSNNQYTPFQNNKINHYTLLAVIDEREQDNKHLVTLNTKLATPLTEEEWQARCDDFQTVYETSLELSPRLNKDFLKIALNGGWPVGD